MSTGHCRRTHGQSPHVLELGTASGAEWPPHVNGPPHVNVDEIVVKALAQSSGGRILREEK